MGGANHLLALLLSRPLCLSCSCLLAAFLMRALGTGSSCSSASPLSVSGGSGVCTSFPDGPGPTSASDTRALIWAFPSLQDWPVLFLSLIAVRLHYQLLRLLADHNNRVIQKTQNQFNDTNCAQPKCDVAKMQEDLHLRPPALVSWEDMELVNGMVNGRAQAHLEAAPACRMQPVSPLGILSLILNIMCGALNLIRGVHLAEYSWQEDHEGMINVVAFLLPFMSCFGLCYLYLFYTSARKIKVSVLFVTLCLCNVYLYGLRNHWQILFHVAVASLSSHQILTRQVAKRPPDLGV
ncbi:vesicle-trafficking protein SEC22c isoform X1 [Ahaetulla prasina]|uniref:vesicle-trafficking protein SEC22c isoform X1 n=1 Tax=Ahaetulla prasina TaxID=499056 RepID=UPI0026479C41|nr:vesicle-trafficking protein SEC22c isoform X1 [Ahaetulla prasina]